MLREPILSRLVTKWESPISLQNTVTSSKRCQLLQPVKQQLSSVKKNIHFQQTTQLLKSCTVNRHLAVFKTAIYVSVCKWQLVLIAIFLTNIQFTLCTCTFQSYIVFLTLQLNPFMCDKIIPMWVSPITLANSWSVPSIIAYIIHPLSPALSLITRKHMCWIKISSLCWTNCFEVGGKWLHLCPLSLLVSLWVSTDHL